MSTAALALTAVAAGPAAAAAAGATARPGITAGVTARPAISSLDGSAQPFLQSQPTAAGISPIGPGVSQPHRAPRPVRRTPRQIAWRMLRTFGWSDSQFRYLNWLWDAESGWNVYATNPFSGAYGIPQAVPGSKMASAGPRWRTSATTQIRWGLRYIRAIYGSPRRAWDHEVSFGWY